MAASNSSRVMDQLRTATHELHAQVEALPFFKALMDGKLPLESYVGQLRAMAIVHAVLDNTVKSLDHPSITSVWEAGMRKLPLLEQDLAYFEPHTNSRSAEATDIALKMAEQIRLSSVQVPITLLGYLYVLEGSTQGAAVLRPEVARTFGLTGTGGLNYLTNYGSSAKEHWEQFGRRMNLAVTLPVEQRQVVQAAREAFQGFAQMFAALFPLRSTPARPLATSLNPEAGSHPIPSDPREIAAAIRAGETCWKRFPYFEWRYAERGRKFASSDSAWLVTLSEHDQALVNQQITWLSQVLAARGMPQLTLETHLKLLYQELVRAIPEKQESYRKLLAASDHLAETRRNQIDDQRFQLLVSEFDAAVGPDWNERLRGAGDLLVAAVADEKAGIDNAVESIEEWMSDVTRFPQTWVDAVHSLIQKART